MLRFGVYQASRLGLATTVKLLKNKNSQAIYGFELRIIDANGDALDVTWYDTLEEALEPIERAAEFDGDEAWVIERVLEIQSATKSERLHQVMHTGGNLNSLRAGGWLG
jgi:hypothetical protein